MNKNQALQRYHKRYDNTAYTQIRLELNGDAIPDAKATQIMNAVTNAALRACGDDLPLDDCDMALWDTVAENRFSARTYQAILDYLGRFA